MIQDLAYIVLSIDSLVTMIPEPTVGVPAHCRSAFAAPQTFPYLPFLESRVVGGDAFTGTSFDRRVTRDITFTFSRQIESLQLFPFIQRFVEIGMVVVDAVQESV
jgi:hypothetical protein